MAAPISLARWTALCVSLVIAWGAGNRVCAAIQLSGVGVSPGRCNGSDCTPKAVTFGHYPPVWREWPAEVRPDRTFPQSIGAERLPAAAGEKEVPLPVETLTPRPGEAPGGVRLPAELPSVPPGPEKVEPGEILPPNKKIHIEEHSPLEKPSQTPLPLEPPEEGLLPRMPLESPPSQTLPKLPLESPPSESSPKLPLELPPSGTLPGLPLEPAPSPAKEVPAESPRPQTPAGGQTPNTGRLPRSVEPPIEAPPPAATPEPKGGGGAGIMNPRAPRIQESVPFPVEPWAEPRPWRPEPARQATYQAPIGPPFQTRPWEQPTEPRVAGPDEPRVERPIQASLERPTAPRVEQPVPPPAPAAGQSPGLDGYCPVQLAETEQWVLGDPRWAVSFQGRTYLTSGPDRQRRFLANPNRYAPVLSGVDPVLALDEKSSVPGQTEFCVVYDGRLYMFSRASTLARFHQNPKHYAAMAVKRGP